MGYLNHKYLYQGYSISSTRGLCRLESFCGALGPGSPRPSSHHPLPLLCAAPQPQPPTGPPDAVAPPKLPQPLVDLVHVASLPTLLVGCICQPCGNLLADQPGKPTDQHSGEVKIWKLYAKYDYGVSVGFTHVTQDRCSSDSHVIRSVPDRRFM